MEFSRSHRIPSLRTATYAIPGYLQVVTCLQRAFQRFRNDPAAPISFAVANAILALVLASVFYNLPSTAESMDRRAVLIFFSLMLTAFTPAFEVNTPRRASSYGLRRNRRRLTGRVS